MTRLLLLNGLPGTGTSTLAARYCADRPMSLRLDIDVVRGSPRTQAHRDAHVLLDRDGGVATVPELHRRLLDVLRRRPRAQIVEPVVGDVDRTYRTLIDVLDEAGS